MFSPSSKQDKSVRASKEEILTDKERLARILKLYKKIAKIIIEKVRSQYIYDEALGWPEDNIPPGTKWEDVPLDWTCPDCGARKEDFQMVEV